MQALTTSLWRRLMPGRRPALPDLSRVQPAEPVGRVVFSVASPRGIGAGKMDPAFFFPPFAFELGLRGIEVVLAPTVSDLVRACETRLELVVVHVYNEDFDEFPHLIDFDRRFPGTLIFNRAELGLTIGWKRKTHDYLTRRGIEMPRLAEELPPGMPVFSNDDHHSDAPVHVVRDRAALDPGRYNAEFVDTVRHFRGTAYHTSVRLLCVGREIVHALVRATDASASVRARGGQTPLDPALFRHFYGELVVERRAELVDFAARLGDALGPGFYAHDIVLEAGSSRIALCEPGFKFDDVEHRGFWLAMAAHLPERELVVSPVQAALSGIAFVGECRRHGRFAGARAVAKPSVRRWNPAAMVPVG